jgi:predicted CxxxxCH...CXXCH cytochrome family protein
MLGGNMNRFLTRRSLALAAVAVVSACGGNKPSPAGTSGEQKGQYGVSYFVSVSRPVGGTITSFDGRIDCGTAGGTKNKCDPVFFAWGVTATFTATPDAGQFFQSWAGDCSGAIASGVGGCSLDTLTYGADKWVVAVFNPSDQLGHSRIPNPAQHSPLFFDFIKSKATPNPGVPKCTNCHGVNYDGVANAPSCTACHAAAGHGNWLTDCTFCHGNPPASHKPTSTNCNGCHPDTVLANGTINAATGKHMNGAVDVSTASCGTCHGFPPATGAHLAHYGVTSVELVGAAGTTGYGDLGTLETRFPNATPTTAPSKYAFGCGHCHPTDSAKHDDGTVDVDLAPAVAGSLKMRNDPLAAFNSGTKSCSGVYCHSSGQEIPGYVSATPAWGSTVSLGCGGCHGNPPNYASGGANSKTANSHVALDSRGTLWGHFALPMFSMYDPTPTIRHAQGMAWTLFTTAYNDAAPVTCQTCHSDTTDPGNVRGAGGFYYLDASGAYAVSGDPRNQVYTCASASCHQAGAGSTPVGSGKVLPLRHVNGRREVTFDRRTEYPGTTLVTGITPSRPYWFTPSTTTNSGWPFTNVSFFGTSYPSIGAEFDLSNSAYDPGTKTCTNVACHGSQGNTAYTGLADYRDLNKAGFYPLRWGATNWRSANPADGEFACQECHRK